MSDDLSMRGDFWEGGQRPDKVFPEAVDKYIADIQKALYEIVRYFAPKIETWMKQQQNAVWTDRTGNARQALWAEAKMLVDDAVLYFGHGMEYGEYLETMGYGRFAVVTPALDTFGPQIWKAVWDLFS